MEISNLLIKASIETGDPLWQLPLWQNYNDQILSGMLILKILEVVDLVVQLQQRCF